MRLSETELIVKDLEDAVVFRASLSGNYGAFRIKKIIEISYRTKSKLWRS
ncbi:MAG: hypothetical protein AABX16_03495 [Nanoarchaeota archaeon]